VDAIVNWVQSMQGEGHVYTEIRVSDPWRQVLLDAGHSAALIGPAHAGNEDKIEYITDSGSYFAVLSH
jgi:hypothetical protein